MGSESSSSGTGSSDAARRSVQRRQYQKQVQEREEKRVQEIDSGAYVRAEKGGSIVRSSSGSAVIAGRSGQQAVEQARQEEIDRRYPTQEAKTKAAIRDLEMRKRSVKLPGILGAVSRISIDNQIKQLQEGGTAQFSRTTSGGFVQTGVVPVKQAPDPTPNIPTLGRRVDAPAGTTQPATQEATKEVTTTAETTPLASPSLASAATSDAARRRLLAQSQKGARTRRFYG